MLQRAKKTKTKNTKYQKVIYYYKIKMFKVLYISTTKCKKL